MREIKFRAWDKDDKVMRNWEELILEKDKGDDFYLLGYEESKVVTSYDHEQVLMQFTGLKDKNGREIYEGDVVDDSYVSPLSGERVEKHYRVIYEKAGYNAHMIGSHPFGSTWLEFLSKKREVIGNIYEHPHLLEVQHE